MSQVKEYLGRLKKEARELRCRGLEEEAEEIEDEISAIEMLPEDSPVVAALLKVGTLVYENESKPGGNE